MSYVKFINSKTIEEAPKNKGSIINFNINTELLKADGYKPLVKVDEIEQLRIHTISYTEDEEYVYENIEYLETSEEAQIRINNKNINKQISNLTQKINELDLKRIRAVCEPSLKDENTGETWLDYYNQEILKLREEIINLNGQLVST